MPKIADGVRAARRDQIITAAVACFARTGYHATTMGDVAEQAGVSKGTPTCISRASKRCSSSCTSNGTAGSPTA